MRSLITKAAALPSQKTMLFKDRCAVQQKGHSSADGFTHVSGFESQTSFQCTSCHQEMELKYLAQWLLLWYLLAEAEISP